jgi:subtilase family serine protease
VSASRFLLALLTGWVVPCGLWGQWLRPELAPRNHARPPHRVQIDGITDSAHGFSPAQIKKAYGFDRIANQGGGQTIAIVDAYDNPNAEADLAVFSAQFGLPACTAVNRCLQTLYSSGTQPATNPAWTFEISLDIQWAHAIAPEARLLLVEAPTSRLTDLLSAVDLAVRHGASVVSMSWGANEFYREAGYDSHFNVHNVIFTASSGDTGSGVEYPAAAANVVGVGGTTLSLEHSGEYEGETPWQDSGGGVSFVEAQPSFQLGFQKTGGRSVPDVAYNADPHTGYAVYDSAGYAGASGWFQGGGTSAGAPQWAALFAIANSLRVNAGKLPLDTVNFSLYQVAASGNEGRRALSNAGTRYDFLTGLGSPRADLLIPALVAQP